MPAACEVSNNRVFSNYGTYGGGIRIGHTALVDGTATSTQSTAFREDASQLDGAERREREAGGGGRHHAGYRLQQLHRRPATTSAAISRWPTAAALSHLGRSPATGSTELAANRIASNKFIFNQTFDQARRPERRWSCPSPAARRSAVARRRYGRRDGECQPVPGQPGRRRCGGAASASRRTLTARRRGSDQQHDRQQRHRLRRRGVPVQR